MRTTILSLTFALLMSVSALAQSPNAQLSAHDHLIAVNPLWSGYEIDQDEIISFQNEDDRISYHLSRVIDMLRSRTNALSSVTDDRLALLSALETYSKEKRFPMNTHHTERIPYFIDDYGTACAVGHLIRTSGHEALAQRISLEHNYDRLAQIKTDGVSDWASTHGFTLDELALIQPAYPPVNTTNSIGQGVNGPIYEMYTRPAWTRLYITGDFDTMDGTVSCESGFGYIEDGEYHCISDAPVGPVMHMSHANQGADLMVAGQFDHEGATYPLAIFDGESWSYIGIPGLPAALGKVATSNYSAYSSLILAVSPNGVSGEDEIWRLDTTDGENWVRVLSVNGTINCVEPNNGMYFGGSFDQIIPHESDDIEYEADGLFLLTSNQWSGDEISPFVSEYLADEIQDIERFGSLLYVAGTNDEETPNTYLTRLENGVFLPQIFDDGEGSYYAYVSGAGIYDIQILSNGDIMFGGDISMTSFTTYGDNLGVYHPSSGQLEAVAHLGEPVHSLTVYGGSAVFAGEFAEDIPPGLNHIGRVGVVSAIDENEYKELALYPNPVVQEFAVDIDAREVEELVVRDMTGRAYAIQYRGQGSKLRIDSEGLSTGIYLLTIRTQGGAYSARFVKE